MVSTNVAPHAWIATIAGLLILPCAARAAEWPQWLGPDRNGVTSEVVPAWTAPPKVLWRREVANGYSSPIVADGMVYLHCRSTDDTKEAEEVFAWDAETGKPVWSESYDRDEYKSILGTGPRATPLVWQGKLFTFGITGVLTCFEAKSGKRLWQINPYQEHKSPLPKFGVCSSPVAAAGRVVVLVGGGGTAVTAYDCDSGKLMWKGLDEPASSASPSVWIDPASDKPVFIVQTTLRLLGMTAAEGKVLWEHPLVFEPEGVSPTPLRFDNTLVCTTQDTGTLALQLPTNATDRPGEAWQRREVRSYFSTGTLGAKGTVLVVTNEKAIIPRADLRCFDLEKGAELWKRVGVGYYHFATIRTGDGKLLLLNDTGQLSLADVTREGYKELASSKVSGASLCNPALANGRMYIRDDKELICLQLADPAK